MKLLMCLILWGLVLMFPVYSENSTELLTSLKQEINFLERCLIAIGNELNQMQLMSQQLLQQNELEQQALKSRIDYLEKEYERVKSDKARLEKDYKVLSESEGLPMSLQQTYKETVETLQGQIRLWRIIAVSEAAVLVGVLVYLILK